MDLNILYEGNSSTLKRIVERAFELDFECVAINTVISSSVLSGKNITIPDPPTIDFTGKPGKKCRVVSRLTAIIEDNIHSHHLLKHPSTKKYDILAIQPIGEKVLQHVCSSLDVDIICLNLTENLGFRLKRKCLGQAIRKGTFFEISFAPCLRDQTSRRMVISNAQLLVDITRGGKSVIISSGASKFMELRGVEDVINLGLLFGFPLDRSATAVRKNGSLVLAHAATRNKSGCGFVSLSGMYRMPKHQGWIVKACKVPKAKQICPTTSMLKQTLSVEIKSKQTSKKRKQNSDSSIICKKMKDESDISLISEKIKEESDASLNPDENMEESDVSLISEKVKKEYDTNLISNEIKLESNNSIITID